MSVLIFSFMEGNITSMLLFFVCTSYISTKDGIVSFSRKVLNVHFHVTYTLYIRHADCLLVCWISHYFSCSIICDNN